MARGASAPSIILAALIMAVRFYDVANTRRQRQIIPRTSGSTDKPPAWRLDFMKIQSIIIADRVLETPGGSSAAKSRSRLFKYDT